MAGDFTGDGRVDLNDFGRLKQNFGVPPAAVPEPSAALLLAVGVACLTLTFCKQRRAR